jgi:hypothetical protein
MTRTYKFAKPIGFTECRLADGSAVRIPVIPGILKHPRPGELEGLLQDQDVAYKYTRLALEKAAWQVLKEFPLPWLVACLAGARLREGRRRALRFLMKLDPSPFQTQPGQ